MKRSFACSVPALLFLAHSISADFALPSYTVDLSKPPEHRYDHIITPDVARKIQATLDAFFPPHSVAAQAAEKVLELLLASNSTDTALFHPELIGEARGVARLASLKLSQVLMITAFYDLVAAKLPKAEKACTGIVSLDATGQIVHGRNLDFDNAAALRPLAAMINYTHPSQPHRSYVAVTYLSMVGFNTVYKPGAFTLSQDERNAGNVLSNLWDLFVRHRLTTFSKIRQVAESTGSFSEALEQLSQAKFPSPSYFILGGTNAKEGGIVLAHDHNGVVESRTIGDNEDPWYVVETNYDASSTPPFGDRRREVAERLMERVGPARFGMEEMMSVIGNDHEANSTAGERNLNNNGTTFSCVMSAQLRSLTCVGRGSL